MSIRGTLGRLLEPLLYGAGIRAYSAGVRLAALRNPKARDMVRGHASTWRTLKEKIDPKARYVWVHASSLGEFEQGRPLIEKIRRENPGFKVLLTFFSPSGYNVRKDYPGADCTVYLPFDTGANADRLLNMVPVAKAVFVKYEVWRNYLRALHRRQIPVYLISACFRPDQAFFKKGMEWYCDWLRLYTHIFVQDPESARLLLGQGIDNVTIAGDTRFDRVTDIMRGCRRVEEVETFLGHGPRPQHGSGELTLVAGSSWGPDEDALVPWLNANPMVKAVIAPHEFDQERLQALSARFSGGAVLLSQLRQMSPQEQRKAAGKQVLIVDCFGLLSSLYAYADLTYVGGGFGAGIHNLNEAAVYGVPVIFGPRHERFLEASDLIGVQGGFSIPTKEALKPLASRMLYDSAWRHQCGAWAGEYIQSKLGATDKIYGAIF